MANTGYSCRPLCLTSGLIYLLNASPFPSTCSGHAATLADRDYLAVRLTYLQSFDGETLIVQELFFGLKETHEVEIGLRMRPVSGRRREHQNLFFVNDSSLLPDNTSLTACMVQQGTLKKLPVTPRICRFIHNK